MPLHLKSIAPGNRGNHPAQGPLELLYAKRSTAPSSLHLIAAMDMGDCIAMLQPWASRGTILEYSRSDQFQKKLVEPKLDVVHELVSLVLIQTGGDCALKHTRVSLMEIIAFLRGVELPPRNVTLL
jgi:hypothetical protein